MALDPNISLAVAPAGGQQVAQAGGNPLALVEGYVDTAQKLQQFRLLNQTLQARQRASEIIAATPANPDGSINYDAIARNVFADPTAAFGAAETMNQLRQGALATTQQQSEIGKMQSGGVQSLITALMGSVDDPNAAAPLAQSIIQATPPQARGAVQGAYENLQRYLDSVPPAERKQRLTALGLGMGALAPEAYRQTTGNISPQYTQPGLVPAGGPGSAGGNALGVPSAATPSLQTSLQPQAGIGAGVAGDGKPLIPPNTPMTSPNLGTGTGGAQVLSPNQTTISHQLAQDFATTGMKDLNSAQAGLASLRYMDNAFDQMVKGGPGGFLVPGTLANSRAALARFANTAAQIIGKPVPFDASQIASIEDFNKETRRMGAQVTNSFFGGNHEAAQTIMNMTQSVPNIENTYLGGKLVTEGIRQALQRVIDMRNFQSTWAQQNQGNLTGSIETFNRLHPAEDYANTALARFGLGTGGFQSPEAIRQAYRSGYLTLDQAKSLAHQQFPGGPNGSR